MSDIDILLIGRPKGLFTDTIEMPECIVHDNPFEGIRAAARGVYTRIVFVIHADQSRNIAALQAIRKCNKNASIYVLATMPLEPFAIDLVSQALADDYVLYPVQHAAFLDSLKGLHDSPAAQHEKPVKTDIDEASSEKMVHLEKLATEDELTGLKNRRYFFEFLRQILDYEQRQGGKVMLLIFDIDNFKSYNDRYGHVAGDKILNQVALLIRRCCRYHDIVGRLGGDEFGVIFWDKPRRHASRDRQERRSVNADHPKDAIFISDRFRNELKKAEFNMLGPGGKGVLTISGGLATSPDDGRTVEELFSMADKALLQAKRSGKNQIYLVGLPNNDIAHYHQSQS